MVPAHSPPLAFSLRRHKLHLTLPFVIALSRLPRVPHLALLCPSSWDLHPGDFLVKFAEIQNSPSTDLLQLRLPYCQQLIYKRRHCLTYTLLVAAWGMFCSNTACHVYLFYLENTLSSLLRNTNTAESANDDHLAKRCRRNNDIIPSQNPQGGTTTRYPSSVRSICRC
ncbi:hypothetical protein P691DRAFT_805820 [Macrolepiota fuliginosa MF-IS2]|uniref:Uncharacterized protein n=1 Tax=Macrolepiota fuliginosa MF-IS2 TaxID=1400762 RepID=A0A9P6C8C1_9AGAR|nr:hypothetical protein P691DRAFT_805820 [Macrolepiota fuliginosa MF-IS2]